MPEPVRSVSIEERRARLGIRHGLAPGASFGGAIETARQLVGLHASDPTVPFLSVRARIKGFEPSQLEHELYDTKSLTKHMAMRRTLFVFPNDTLALAHSACSVAVARAQRKRLIKMIEDQSIAADGAGWLTEAENDVLAELSTHGPATGAQLSRSLPSIQARLRYGEGTKWIGQAAVSSRVFTQLALDGRIRLGCLG